MQCGDGAVGGEVVEGRDAAVAFVGAGVSPGVEAGADDCGLGGGDSVSAAGGDVGVKDMLWRAVGMVVGL